MASVGSSTSQTVRTFNITRETQSTRRIDSSGPIALAHELHDALAQDGARVAAIDRLVLFPLRHARIEEPQMPRQRVERRLLVVELDPRAFAIAVARLDVGDGRRIRGRQLLLIAQGDALGPPFSEIADIGEGDVSVLGEHAITGDARLFSARRQRL